MAPDAKAYAILNAKTTLRAMKNQIAIAEIAKDSAKEGTDFSSASGVDEDWLSRYMDAGKHVSDEEMQVIWGSVLADEFEEPGSTPSSVIRILSELPKKYATVFANLCSLEITIFPENESGKIESPVNAYLVSSEKEQNGFLEDLDITFKSLTELDKLGLIKYDSVAGFIHTYEKKVNPNIHVYAQGTVISCLDYPDESFPIGSVILTDAGTAIARVVNRINLPGFQNYVEEFYQSAEHLKISDTPHLSITEVKMPDRTTGYRYKRIYTEQQGTQKQQ